MIPVLYDKGETEFKTNGLGRPLFTSCTVNEVINDKFELTAELSTSDKHFKDIAVDRIILASCEQDNHPQPFRIYDIKKKSEQSVSIQAEHISYMLNSIPVAPPSSLFTELPHPSSVLSLIKQNSLEPNPFTFNWDKSMESVSIESKRAEAKFDFTEPKTARSLLGDDTRSGILGVFHTGEYKFDRYNVHLYDRRGTDSHVSIRYDKNIKTLSQDENIENTVTGVYCFYRKEETPNDQSGSGSSSSSGSGETIDHSGVYGDSSGAKRNFIMRAPAANSIPTNSETKSGTNADGENVNVNYVTCGPLHSDNYQMFSYPRTTIVDASSVWDHVPSNTEIQEYTQAYADAKMLGVPELSLDIDFISLWQKKDFEKIEKLEKLHLGDSVQVIFPDLNVYANGEITEYTWDVMSDAYTKFKIGNSTGIADTIMNYTKYKYKKEVEYIAKKTSKDSSKQAYNESIAHSTVYTDGALQTYSEGFHKTLQDYYTKAEVNVYKNEITSTVEENKRYFDGQVTDINANLDDLANADKIIDGKFVSYYNKSEIDQKADSITSTVQSNYTELNKQGQNIDAKYDQRCSSIEQTASGISSTVTANHREVTGEIGNLKETVSNAQSEIKQNADSISAKVDKNGVIAAINLDSTSASISADKINLTGDLIINKINGSTNKLDLKSGLHVYGDIHTDSRITVGTDNAQVVVRTDRIGLYHHTKTLNYCSGVKVTAETVTIGNASKTMVTGVAGDSKSETLDYYDTNSSGGTFVGYILRS